MRTGPVFNSKAYQLVDPLDPRVLWALLLALVGLFGVADFLTGAQVAVTVLYFIPISLGAWLLTTGQGASIAISCSLSYLAVQLFGASQVVSPRILAWNFVVELIVFLTITFLVRRLRLAMINERQTLLLERRALSEQYAHTSTIEMQLHHAERLATVGKLAAGLAHELGTPLNVIAGYAKIIETAAGQKLEIVTSAQIVGTQAANMTRIIQQLADFSRIRSPSRSEQNIFDVVQSSISFIKPLASKEQVTLSCAEGTNQRVSVDVGQMQQVFTNLMVNAIHASAALGEVSLAIEPVDRDGPEDLKHSTKSWISVSVTDAGHGIKPENLAHVFEPFFTTKDTGEGTGLGLAVAYGIVRQHGGWIEAKNNPTQGARFTVFLPAAPHERQAAA